MKPGFIAVALAATLSFGSARAEKWACYQGYGSYKKDLFSLTNEITQPAGQFHPGTVEVAGTSQTAVYYVDGVNRRWDWGWPDKQAASAKHTIVIMPSGSAAYYDFSIKVPAPPSQLFQCEQR